MCNFLEVFFVMPVQSDIFQIVHVVAISVSSTSLVLVTQRMGVINSECCDQNFDALSAQEFLAPTPLTYR